MSCERNAVESRERNTTVIQEDEQGLRIEMLELFYRLLERFWVIVLAGLLSALAGGLYTHFFVPDSYTASAKLYVIGSEEAMIDLSSLNVGAKLADDYVQVFKNRDVYETVRSGYPAVYGSELPYTFSQVQEQMKVDQLGDTRILKITFTCGDPEEALNVVEAYVKTAQSFMDVRMGTSLPEQPFESPYVSTQPTSPNLMKNVVLSFAAGVMVTIVVLLCLFIFDDRIRTAEQLEKRLALPTLGLVPVEETAENHRVKKGRKA